MEKDPRRVIKEACRQTFHVATSENTRFYATVGAASGADGLSLYKLIIENNTTGAAAALAGSVIFICSMIEQSHRRNINRQ